jgi:hypothetical protein
MRFAPLCAKFPAGDRAAAFGLPWRLSVKPVALALTFAIVLPANAARAAAPRESEQSYRELEAKSELDLSREWAKYNRDRRSGSFAGYVDRRYRARRNAGLGLAVAGGALVFASVFFFCFGLTGPDVNGPGLTRVNYAVAGTTLGLGVGSIISGAVLSGVYARRLDRLEDAAVDVGVDARELASRPRDRQLTEGGLGLRVSF